MFWQMVRVAMVTKIIRKGVLTKLNIADRMPEYEILWRFFSSFFLKKNMFINDLGGSLEL